MSLNHYTESIRCLKYLKAYFSRHQKYAIIINHSFSFWDSIVAATALDCDTDYLITEDMQDGFKFENKLTIMNPFK